MRACEKARDAKKTVEVLAFERQGDQGGHGRRLAAEMATLGFATMVVGDLPARDASGWAPVALIGADAATPQFVVNGASSLALARAAQGRMPFYVVCESVKFAGEASPQTGYDRVQHQLLTGIVTEEGVLTPADVGRRLEQGRG